MYVGFSLLAGWKLPSIFCESERGIESKPLKEAVKHFNNNEDTVLIMA